MTYTRPTWVTGGNMTATEANALGDAAAAAVVSAPYPNGTDDTSVLQALIDAAYTAGGGVIRLRESSQYIVSHLHMKSRVWIIGPGWGTTVLHKAAATQDLFSFDGDVNTFWTGLADFRIDGNRTNQTTAVKAINWDNTGGSGDMVHTVSNVHVTNVKGTGLRLGTQIRACRVTGVYAVNCDVGVELVGTDNALTAVDVGLCDHQGFLISGLNNRLVNCKGFYSGQVATGDNFSISGNNNTLVGCESQDAVGRGIYISGVGNNVDMVFDSNQGACVYLDAAQDNRIVGHIANSGRAFPSAAIQVNASPLRNHVRLTFTPGAFPTYGTSTLAATNTEFNDVQIGNIDGEYTVSYASSIIPQPHVARTTRITLTGNITITNTSSLWSIDGMYVRLIFTQDATGGRTVSWGTQYVVNNWTPNTAANKVNVIDFMWVYGLQKWVQVGGLVSA